MEYRVEHWVAEGKLSMLDQTRLLDVVNTNHGLVLFGPASEWKDMLIRSLRWECVQTQHPYTPLSHGLMTVPTGRTFPLLSYDNHLRQSYTRDIPLWIWDTDDPISQWDAIFARAHGFGTIIPTSSTTPDQWVSDLWNDLRQLGWRAGESAILDWLRKTTWTGATVSHEGIASWWEWKIFEQGWQPLV